MISLSTLFCGFAFLNGDRVIIDMVTEYSRHDNRIIKDIVTG